MTIYRVLNDYMLCPEWPWACPEWLGRLSQLGIPMSQTAWSMSAAGLSTVRAGLTRNGGNAVHALPSSNGINPSFELAHTSVWHEFC
jgi:hypothetical protein